jgi:hypothetical protein
MKHIRQKISLIFLLIFLPAISHAIIIPSTLENLTEFSGLIITGTVLDKVSYFEKKMIYTDITVQVETVIKNGNATQPAKITVTVPGGTVGDLHLDVDESPGFAIGERVMLFLRQKAGMTKYQPFALNYGVFRIITSEGQDYVKGPMFDYDQLVDLKTMQPRRNTSLKTRQPLSTFIDQVKNISNQLGQAGEVVP